MYRYGEICALFGFDAPYEVLQEEAEMNDDDEDDRDGSMGQWARMQESYLDTLPDDTVQELAAVVAFMRETITWIDTAGLVTGHGLSLSSDMNKCSNANGMLKMAWQYPLHTQ